MRNFTVTIELDCTPRVETLLRTVVAFLPKDKQAIMTAECESQDRKNTFEAVSDTQVASKANIERSKTEIKTQKNPSKEITNDDIRSHIKACRERILSELSGDAYATAHNALNQLLRDKVAEFGVEKASELPQEHKKEFIAYCDSIINLEPF